MDSSAHPDRLSNLPDVLLIMILSCLAFKDCVKTSCLSKRWRYLYRETRNVAFRESDFVHPSIYGQLLISEWARFGFVDYVCRWIARIHDQPIDSFEISISNPETYLDQIQDMIKFAVRKRVRKLILDFSHPTWRTFHNVPLHELLVFVVEVPKSVYNLTSLESLRICACKNFDPTRFLNPGKFKSLSFGWMKLANLESLLSKSSRLESLSIHDCWELEVMKIAGDMRELAIENCDLFLSCCSFDLPRVDIFRYSGDIFCLEFDRMNTIIKEVSLDFGVLSEYDEFKDSTNAEGGMVCDIINKLRSAKTLTVCPYLLQVIERSEHPHLLRPLNTHHLVLKTKLHPKEFNGIKILLNNCPDLETLTFDMLPLNFIVTASLYADIDPRTYWMQTMTYNGLGKTLKVVVVRNFVGGMNELNMLKYLIRFGREHEHVLERIELYVPYGLEESQKMFAYAKAKMLQRSSKHVQVSYA